MRFSMPFMRMDRRPFPNILVVQPPVMSSHVLEVTLNFFLLSLFFSFSFFCDGESTAAKQGEKK